MKFGFIIILMLGLIVVFSFAITNYFSSVRGVIVNHHLLAPGLIKNGIAKLDKNFDKIVIISPDHFNLNFREISTPDKVIATSLNIKYDPRLSKYEHGLGNILPFAKDRFPKSEIWQIAIGEGVDAKIIDRLVISLASIQNAGYILSSDMSHNLDYRGAYFHDKYTLDIILNLDNMHAQRAETDSKKGLQLFLKLMREIGVNKFNLLERIDGASIVSDPKTGENTSYITGYFTAGTKNSDISRPITIFACGDMMFDRDVRQSIAKSGFDSLFGNYNRLFDGADISLANLEGPITNNKSQATDNNLIFTFDPNIAQKIKLLGLNLVSLANNHTLNFGEDGLAQTRNFLDVARVEHFGDPNNLDDKYLIKNIKGKKIAFVGYHQFSYKGAEKTLEIIKKVRHEADMVIVMAHWGNEYETKPSQRQRDEARLFVDAGADIIIGSHPHVIQPIEVYKNKPIFYSLGNCMFDQYFSPQTKQGLALGIILSQKSKELILMPINNTPLKFGLINYDEADKIINNIASMSFVDEKLKSDMKDGIFTLP